MHLDCGKFIPCAFALLPGKSGALYNQVLKSLVDYVGDVSHVEKFSCDFERAVHNAIEAFFPNAVISCCYFHFSQAVFRKIRENGCTLVYNNVGDFRKLVSYIYGLPFVPPEEIVSIWNNVIMIHFNNSKEQWTDTTNEENGYSCEVENFLKYMEKTWIGEELRRGRRDPLYSHQTWNKWDCVMSEDHVITNNGNESYNSSWVPSVPKSSSVWTVIECFKREESMARLTFSETIRGVHQSHNRSRNEHQKTKMMELYNICVNFGKTTPTLYMDMIIHHFE